MNPMTCDQLGDVADELALDLLTGVERASALRHLEHCEVCRSLIASLADTADLVLLATPVSPPPTGFESRVLARIEHDHEPAKLPIRRRWLRPALIAAAVVAVLMVAVLTVATISDPGGSSVAAAAMRAGDGTVVGSAQLDGDDPANLVVNVTDWQKAAGTTPQPPYRLAIDQRDGTRRFVTLPPESDFSWQVSVPAATAEISGVALVDQDDTILCSARFDTPS